MSGVQWPVTCSIAILASAFGCAVAPLPDRVWSDVHRSARSSKGATDGECKWSNSISNGALQVLASPTAKLSREYVLVDPDGTKRMHLQVLDSGKFAAVVVRLTDERCVDFEAFEISSDPGSPMK